ncbi:MAG: ribosomal subunit protein [Pseudomonadota bacterium]|jgi:large subunit ribosomal protein L15
MRLNELKDKEGARKFRVRVGRGIGSGVGKTGGRGVKGQTSRTGVALAGFEGGQMPLHRRLPKRGFSKWRRADYNAINIEDLQAAVDRGRLDASKLVDARALVAAGLIRRPKDGVRVLGRGELKARLELTVDHVSGAARAAVEAAGGTINIIEKKVLAADVAKREKTARKKGGNVKPKSGGDEE